jgi:hypothetical protein
LGKREIGYNPHHREPVLTNIKVSMLHRCLKRIVLIAAITLAGLRQSAAGPRANRSDAADHQRTGEHRHTRTPVANTTRDTNHNADPANPYPRTRAGNFFR